MDYPRLGIYIGGVNGWFSPLDINGDINEELIPKFVRFKTLALNLEALRVRPKVTQRLIKEGCTLLGYWPAFLSYTGRDPYAEKDRLMTKQLNIGLKYKAVVDNYLDITKPGVVEDLVFLLSQTVKETGIHGLVLDFCNQAVLFDFPMGIEWHMSWANAWLIFGQKLRRALPGYIIVFNDNGATHPDVNGTLHERFDGLWNPIPGGRGNWYHNILGPHGLVTQAKNFNDPKYPWIFTGYDGDKSLNWGSEVRYGLASACLSGSVFTACHSHPDAITKPWDEWFSFYEYNLGEPKGPMFEESRGLFSRYFNNGKVSVRPLNRESIFTTREGKTY